MRGLTTWTSALNGGTRISLSYAANQWTPADQGADTLRLDSVAGDLQLELSVVPADDDSAPALVDGRVTDLGTRLLGLTKATNPADVILGPSIGGRAGAGDAYVGALDTPQGISEQQFVTVVAAAHGGTGVVATTTTAETDPNRRRTLYQLVDGVLSSVRWVGTA